MDDLSLEKPFHISSYNADFTGKANIQSILQFFQETAWEHAEQINLGYSDLIKKNLIWVLLRQKVKIERFPKWQDNIIVKTHARGKDKLFWYRDFEIIDDNQNQLGKATSMWMIIDLNTRRPYSSGDELLNYRIGKGKGYWGESLIKLSSINDGKKSFEKFVTYSDLDLNNHVNNVKYLEWVLDSYDITFLQEHSMDTIELNYLSEAYLADKINVICSINGNSHFHEVRSVKSSKELFRSKIKWIGKTEINS